VKCKKKSLDGGWRLVWHNFVKIGDN